MPEPDDDATRDGERENETAITVKSCVCGAALWKVRDNDDTLFCPGCGTPRQEADA